MISLGGRTLKSLIEIEGMAIAGLIEEISVEDCSEPDGWKRVVALGRDGNVYETKCVEPQAAKRNYLVLSAYTTGWSKRIVAGDSGGNS